MASLLPKGGRYGDRDVRAAETVRTGLRADAIATACRLLRRTEVRRPRRLRASQGSSQVPRRTRRPAHAVSDRSSTEVPASGCCVPHRSARLAVGPRVTSSSRARAPCVRTVTALKESVHTAGVRPPLPRTRRLRRQLPSSIRFAARPPRWLRGSADRALPVSRLSAHHPGVIDFQLQLRGCAPCLLRAEAPKCSGGHDTPRVVGLRRTVPRRPWWVDRGRVRVVPGLPGQETSASRCHLDPGAPRTLPKESPSHVLMPGQGPIPNSFRSTPRFSG